MRRKSQEEEVVIELEGWWKYKQGNGKWQTRYCALDRTNEQILIYHDEKLEKEDRTIPFEKYGDVEMALINGVDYPWSVGRTGGKTFYFTADPKRVQGPPQRRSLRERWVTACNNAVGRVEHAKRQAVGSMQSEKSNLLPKTASPAEDFLKAAISLKQETEFEMSPALRAAPRPPPVPAAALKSPTPTQPQSQVQMTGMKRRRGSTNSSLPSSAAGGANAERKVARQGIAMYKVSEDTWQERELQLVPGTDGGLFVYDAAGAARPLQLSLRDQGKQIYNQRENGNTFTITQRRRFRSDVVHEFRPQGGVRERDRWREDILLAIECNRSNQDFFEQKKLQTKCCKCW